MKTERLCDNIALNSKLSHRILIMGFEITAKYEGGIKMSYDPSKSIELYMLRAENFDENIAPNQKQYYLDAAAWLRENSFDSLEEATEAMKHTPFYEGAGIAKTMDDIQLRIRAMQEAGYDDVAKVHEMRKEKFKARGNGYAFSQEWIEDYNEAAEKSNVYAKRKEIFGRLFSGYFEAECNPQEHHRKEAIKDIGKALDELDELGVTFDELADSRVYRNLTMATEKGIANFIDYIHRYMNGDISEADDAGSLAEEQNKAAKWVKNHRAEVMEIGKSEKWHDACCVAVPSDDPFGYDFIAVREV